MIVVLLNVYLVILFLLVKLKIVPLQSVLEVLAVHRAVAAAGRPVHPDGLGRAAGLRDRGPAIRCRSCPMSPAK